MINVQVRIEGDIVIDRMLQGLESRATDFGPVWPDVVRAFQAIVAKAFDTEGASTGATWAPLKASTQADRVRHGFAPAHPILERTGALKRALTIGEGAHIASTPTSLRYQLSSEVGYYVYHQSKAPRVKLPRRAPVELTFDNRTTIMHPVRLWVTGRTPAVVAPA